MRLNSGVLVIVFNSLGKLFHARGPTGDREGAITKFAIRRLYDKVTVAGRAECCTARDSSRECDEVLEVGWSATVYD